MVDPNFADDVMNGINLKHKEEMITVLTGELMPELEQDPLLVIRDETGLESNPTSDETNNMADSLIKKST